MLKQMIQPVKKPSLWLLMWTVLAVPILARAEKWSRKYINSLPDSAFASVEVAPNGKRRRHLPHHDQTGVLDYQHLLNTLARHSQVKWRAHIQEVREERLATTRVHFPLDLNRATAEELEQLPFIGPARAFAILEERERRGRYQFVEELQEVIGIGPIIYEAIKDLVIVSN